MSKRSTIIISLFFVIVAIYAFITTNQTISLCSVVSEINQFKPTYRLDETSYSDYIGVNLTEKQREELISSLCGIEVKRGKAPSRIHGDRTISFSLISHTPDIRMYFILDICRSEWSYVIINDIEYKISEKDAIDLLHLFNKNLPLDSEHSRCEF